MELEQVRPSGADELRAFLKGMDLASAELKASAVRLWAERDASGRIIGSVGYEISEDRQQILIRSVAVPPRTVRTVLTEVSAKTGAVAS